MSKFLGQYATNYEEVYEKEEEYGVELETNDRKIYTALNKLIKKEVTLKIISKQNLKEGDYDFLLEQLNREEQFTKLCSSPYTVNFYQRLETDEYIIFELEQYDNNLQEYLFNNGEMKREKTLFKEIVISLANALKIIHEKGVMHRDIKPNNIFIREEDGKNRRKK